MVRSYELPVLSRPQWNAEQNRMSEALILVIFLITLAAGMLVASDAFAGNCTVTITSVSGAIGSGTNPICDLFTNLQGHMHGEVADELAVIAVIGCGLLALFGRLTWTQAMVVVLGVGLTFGAAVFFNFIGASSTVDTSLDPVSAVLNSVITSMTGEGGRAVGMVAVTILGMGALFGKITWIQALVLATGIGMVFGATNLVGIAWDTGLTDVTYMATGLKGIYTTSLLTPHPLAGPFMNIILFMVGTTGITIATAGVMAMGFMALVGRLSWPRALVLCAGIALMFGAADVVYILSAPLEPCNAYTGSDTFSAVICGFLNEIQGPTGITIGTLAVIVMGITALLGKISWEFAFMICVGIALIYGANAIVNLMEVSIPMKWGHGIQTISCKSPLDPSPPSTGNAIGDVLCYLLLILYGTAGKALATVAVIMMGFGALMGKVSYAQAFIVAVGIAVTFGAPEITKILVSGANTTGCSLPSSSVIPGLVC